MRTAKVSAAFALASAAHAAEPAFDVLSYGVRLTPDFVTQSVTGEEVIRFKSTESGLTALSFSANTLDVVASLNGDVIVRTEVQGDRRLFHLPHPMRKAQTGRLTPRTRRGCVLARHQALHEAALG